MVAAEKTSWYYYVAAALFAITTAAAAAVASAEEEIPWDQEDVAKPPELDDAADDADGEANLKKMTFQAPGLSDEERESLFLTKDLLCDGCIAVAWRLHEQFKIEHDKRSNPASFQLKEHQVLDLTGKRLCMWTAKLFVRFFYFA